MTAKKQDPGEAFVALADSLKQGHDVIDTMDYLVEVSTEFTSAIEAGIVLADAAGALHVVASTSERTTDVEEEQLGTDEGPCWEAFRTGHLIRSRPSPTPLIVGHGSPPPPQSEASKPRTPCRCDFATRTSAP